MKASTLEVVWHKKEAIHAFDATSVPDDDTIVRVASGGVDCMVRIWFIRPDINEKPVIEHRATLNRHDRGVGCVRFSPIRKDGIIHLATAADDSIIIIWKYEAGRAPMQVIGDSDDDEKSVECWTTAATLRGHIEDVADISWSADGTKLASAGIDHSVIIWDVKEAKKIAHCQNHSHYCQGVAMDPFGVLVASLSADRSLRFYSEFKKKGNERFKPKATSNKIQLPGYDRPVRLWWDDTLPGFVRRLTWSPDGLLCAAPSGEINPAPLPLNKEDQKENIIEERTEIEKSQKKDCVCIYTRGNYRDPAFLLTTPDPSMVTRWCPKLFALREDVQNVTNLAYRMIFAVSTTDSVIFYDTQTMKPCARISDIHYANMTDLAWSHDGLNLFVASRDGYVTRITFSENELGDTYSKSISDVLELVRVNLFSDLNETEEPENEAKVVSLDRLSPALEKMKLKSNPSTPIQTKPIKAAKNKKRIGLTPVQDDPKKTPEKKTKKKIQFTTISSTPQ